MSRTVVADLYRPKMKINGVASKAPERVVIFSERHGPHTVYGAVVHDVEFTAAELGTFHLELEHAGQIHALGVCTLGPSAMGHNYAETLVHACSYECRPR